MEHSARKRFRTRFLKIKKNVNVLCTAYISISYLKTQQEDRWSIFQNPQTKRKHTFENRREEKILKKETDDVLKTNSPDHQCKKAPPYSDNCSKNKRPFKEEENNALLISGKNIAMFTTINHVIIKVCNKLSSYSMKTMPNWLQNFCECAQKQPVKQILPKKTPNNCDLQVFERVDEAMKNESLNALSLIGNAKIFGDAKVFLAKNTKNIIKADVPPEVIDFEVVQTNKGDLVFLTDFLKKFNIEALNIFTIMFREKIQ